MREETLSCETVTVIVNCNESIKATQPWPIVMVQHSSHIIFKIHLSRKSISSKI